MRVRVSKMENIERKTEPVLKNQSGQAETPPPAVEPSMRETLPASPKSSRWPVILAILLILILIIVVGGLLFAVNREIIPWGSKKAIPTPVPTPTPSPEMQLEAEVVELEEQGSSDEINAIEADLEETDLSNLDKELSDIESELETP